MTACPQCPTDPDATPPVVARRGDPILCWRCTRWLRTDITRIPAYIDRLAERLIPTGRGGQPVVTTSRDPGINLDPSVVTIRAELRARIKSWARIVSEDRDVTPPIDTPAAVCAFLLTHWDWICEQEWLEEFADEIRGWTRKAYARIVPARPRQYGGDCEQTLDDGTKCVGTILVNPETSSARCAYCGYEDSASDHWARVFGAVGDDWLATATEASRLLALRDGIHLQPQLIRQWATRRRIVAKGGSASAPTYRLGDIVELLGVVYKNNSLGKGS